ncbi:MAG: MG2 domain-containing protein [Bacteroidia bacterium]
MWNRYLFLLLTAAVGIMSGCTKTVTLKVYPSGEVDVASILNFEFEDSIAPADSVGMWSSLPYLKFDPPISGKWQWRKRNLLSFWPEGGKLPSAMKVSVSANPALFMGENAELSPANFEFHTPYFTAKDLHLTWSDEVDSTARMPMNMHLTFNYPVEPESLRQYLEVFRGNHKVQVLDFSNNYYASTEFDISTDMYEFGPGEQPIEVHLKKGLVSDLKYNPLPEDVVLRDTLLPVAMLSDLMVFPEFEAGSISFKVSANQGIEAGVARPYITIVPEMPFSLRNSGSELVIEGDFKPGSDYHVGFRRNLPGAAGGLLDADAVKTVRTPELKPFLRFADDMGHFLMRGGFENLNVKTTNMDSFVVELYEIYENNLLHFINANPSNLSRWSHFDSVEDYYYGSDYGYLSMDEYGALIHSETVYTPKNAHKEVVNVPIRIKKEFRNKFNGIFVVKLRNASGDHWMEDYKIVSLSDLGLIAKYNDDDIIVFANRLSTAQPAVGATVSLISSTNQAYRTAVVDAQGVARFNDVGNRWDSRTFRLALITAQLGNDIQFLDFDHTDVDQDRFDLEGKSRSDYDVFCYGDRDLYRPGDTLYFSAIVRNWDYTAPKNLPVTVKIYGPSGDTREELQKSTNEDGAIEIAYPISTSARTGYYHIDVLPGMEHYYGEYEFMVEDFVPDKIKVNLTAEKMSGRPGDTLRFPLTAGYYFGAPCDGHAYDVVYKLFFVDYRSKRFPAFDFGNANDASPEWSNSSGQLNELGKDTLEYIIPSNLGGTGLATGLTQVTVYDNTQHTVSAQKTFTVATRPYYLGIREHGSYFSVNDVFKLDYVAVDFADQLAKGQKIARQLVRREWKRVLRKEGDRFYYVSENEAIVLKTDTVVQGADFQQFSQRLVEAGNYELTLSLVDGSATRTFGFSAYGKSVATEASFGVNREGTIAISTDKPSYKVGESARILLTAPFSGRMLVTIEREKVHEYRYVNVENNAAEIILPIRDEHVPNVYVSATLFRPLKGKGQLPLTVAHGYTSLHVENAARRLPIKITSPEVIKPGKSQAITVQTAPRAGVKVTVAVVDEGILAIRHYRTPDAFAEFYADRELNVRSYDMYEYLLPEVPASALATGGDMGDWSSYSQLNPMRNKRYKPLAFWSGILNTNASGRVTVNVPVPEEFYGRVRIMVMAYDGAQFGSEEGKMTVREDLILTTALPRFLTEGDSVQLPVNLTNMMDEKGKVKVTLKIEGPVAIDGPNPAELEMDPQSMDNVFFGLRALHPGSATVTVESDGLAKVKQRLFINVQPPAPLLVEAGNGRIEAGKSVIIKVPSGFDPNFQRTSLAVSSLPAFEFADQLDYLVNYPHGCLEQTVSAAFPQIYFGDLAELIAPNKFENSNSVLHVREAIKKIEGMQGYDGGFTYWPGGEENAWGSVYATHFLLEAQKAGFPVQSYVIDRSISHLGQLAAQKKSFTYHFNRNGLKLQEERASQDLIYSLYVLALAGKPDEGLMNHYKIRPELLCQDSKFLLAAAFALKKDRQGFADCLPKANNVDEPDRLTGGSFDSPLRSASVILSTLADVAPTQAIVPHLVDYLRAHRTQLQSTQERAWAFLAMGKLARRKRREAIQVTAQADGKELLVFTGDNVRYAANDLGGKTITLNATGKGVAYYFWKIEGSKKGASVLIPNQDQDLAVRREWYNTAGRRIMTPVFNQGELIVCRIHLKANRYAENIAVTDLIPAGFEVENTRLTHNDYSWLRNANITDFDNHDVRDDRVNVFVSMESGETRTFEYLVRAVNQGRYLMPPITAEAMYDAGIHSRRSGAVIRIVGKNEVIPGRNMIAGAKDSLRLTRADSARATFTTTYGDNTIWQRFMRNVAHQN